MVGKPLEVQTLNLHLELSAFFDGGDLGSLPHQLAHLAKNILPSSCVCLMTPAWCVAARCVMFEVTDPDDDRHFLCARGMTPSRQGLNHSHPH